MSKYYVAPIDMCTLHHMRCHIREVQVICYINETMNQGNLPFLTPSYVEWHLFILIQIQQSFQA